MSGYTEPCYCGDPGCFRCFGESAKYANWCDNCEFADADEETGEVACTVAPGDDGCRRKEKNDDALVEHALSQREGD